MDWLACRRYLDKISSRGIQPGLGRMRALMSALGSPEQKFKAVHAAGTNGKGSVCAMLESVLRAVGHRTGLYTSPHLLEVTERVRINGRNIGKKKFAQLTGEILRKAGRLEPRLTYFEFVTAVSFLAFARARVEIAIVETGLGGRLDATNVLPQPEATVITNIGLEHQDYLGDTIEKIAAEKAGILKKGSPAATGARQPALGVIEKIARSRHVLLTRAPQGPAIGGIRVGLAMETCSLKGGFQEENIRLVLETVRILKRRGWKISGPAVARGLASTRWAGRFEWKTVRLGGKRARLLLDGAHNPHAAGALVSSVQSAGFHRKSCALVFNALKDKGVKEMLDILLGKLRVEEVFVPRLPTERSRRPAQVLGIALATARSLRKGLEGRTFPSVRALWGQMKPREGTWVLATGSLYLAGETLKHFNRRNLS